MRIDGRMPITSIAADLPGAIAVFEALGLDYACAGNRSLVDAARAEGIDAEVVIASLRRLGTAEHAQSWHDRPLSDLVRYLVAQHHRFVRDEVGALALRLADLCATYGAVDPDLIAIRAAFTRLADLLLPHLHREEQSIFLAIEAMESTWQSNEGDAFPHDLAGHIRELTVEHGMISAQLRTLRELRMPLGVANGLAPRVAAMLEELAALEAHLHEYMFLENCVLFPRALALEAELQEPAYQKT
jgi:regulator of cell morphogenesis and NO signaling